MSVAAFISGEVGPGVTIPLLITRGLAIGAAAAQVNPRTSGGRVYPYPQDFPKRKKAKVLHLPLPEYEVSGPLSRHRQIENYALPDWDQEAWEASLLTLAELEREDKARRMRKTTSWLLLALLD